MKNSKCGKSKLLEAFIGYIKNTDVNANIIYIDFTELEFEELKEYHKLNDYVKNAYVESKNNYLFIDEVQMCEGFEKTLNSLHGSEKYDIYVTGSNAFLLSSALATLFTGRTFSIEVFPFSLKEYMEYYELADAYEAYTQYRKMGGMSGSYLYRDENSRSSYVNDVFETLVIRDIVQKFKIRNTHHKYNDKLMILWYYVDNKENWIRRDGSRKGKKNVHSYSIKLFISGKFEECSTRLRKRVGLLLCVFR